MYPACILQDTVSCTYPVYSVRILCEPLYSGQDTFNTLYPHVSSCILLYPKNTLEYTSGYSRIQSEYSRNTIRIQALVNQSEIVQNSIRIQTGYTQDTSPKGVSGCILTLLQSLSAPRRPPSGFLKCSGVLPLILSSLIFEFVSATSRPADRPSWSIDSLTRVSISKVRVEFNLLFRLGSGAQSQNSVSSNCCRAKCR